MIITDLDELNKMSEKVIGCAIEVHKHLGPGLYEVLYKRAMSIELSLNKIQHECEKLLDCVYKGYDIGQYRVDILVEDSIVLELKSEEKEKAVFSSQILNNMHLAGRRLGLLINFNNKLLKDGIKRFII
ncbi:MAG: GxxExxY protein [Ignavibacteriae bacterium]|nr:MAG: GxxExxY protein [Ignavibacteriota bacterium]